MLSRFFYALLVCAVVLTMAAGARAQEETPPPSPEATAEDTIDADLPSSGNEADLPPSGNAVEETAPPSPEAKPEVAPEVKPETKPDVKTGASPATVPAATGELKSIVEQQKEIQVDGAAAPADQVLPPVEELGPQPMEDMDTAVLRTIDKLSARTHTFEVAVDKTVKFNNALFIKLRACRKASPLDKPESAAFLQIWEKKTPDDPASWVFSGWMFASSPSLSAMDHPVYDVWVIECKNSRTSAQPSPDHAAPAEAVPPSETPGTPAPESAKPETVTPETIKSEGAKPAEEPAVDTEAAPDKPAEEDTPPD